MEYDTATAPGPSEAQSSHPHATRKTASGHLRIAAPDVDTAPLRQEITFAFSGRTAKNRFLKAPMTERVCHWNAEGQDISARGFPSPEYLRLYRCWGEGEIGVIVAGNLMLRYDAVEAYGNPVLCDDHDNRVAEFRRVAAAAKQHGSLFIAQLSHPGRQGGAALNPNPISASDVQLKIAWAGNTFNKPRPMTVPEIHDMVKHWGEVAHLCHQAGFDGVQIHCAHGYLLAQFLSLTTNLRTDEYGGSLANRSRIILEIIAEIRARVPDPSFIVCVKLNSVEFQPRGSTPSDCRDLCLALEQARVDFVDLSGGTFEGRAFEHKKDSTRARESYFIEVAELVRPVLRHTKVYVTGGFRSAAAMVRALRDGACDGVGLGRPLGAEPHLCRHILAGAVPAALENFVPLPLNTQATGSQIRQVAFGDALVSDFSHESEVARWVDACDRETKRKESILPVVDSSGFPALKAEVGFDYMRLSS